MTNLKLSFVSIIFLLIISYFAYHTIYGNRGYLAKKTIETKIEKAEEELEKVRSDRIEIEHQVKLLRPETLDKDMLEEQARKVLGVAKSEEEVIINAEEKDKNKEE
jgi:cell division protein FtsB